jgi:hypothetical protein
MPQYGCGMFSKGPCVNVSFSRGKKTSPGSGTTFKMWGPSGKFLGYLNQITGPWLLPLFVFSLTKVREVALHMLWPWHAASPQAQDNGTNQSWSGMSQTVSQNNSFFLFVQLSEVFHYSHGKPLTKYRSFNKFNNLIRLYLYYKWDDFRWSYM